MKKFLLEQAKPYIDDFNYESPFIVGYSQDVNDDAINGDAWLDNGTSWVWKVAVLTLFDSNKRDFGKAYLGMQKSPSSEPILIGTVEFGDGENDDCGRVMRRLLNCLSDAEVCFDGKE